MPTTNTNCDPPDDGQVVLPSVKTTPNLPPDLPDPEFPEPEAESLVRRGCFLMVWAFVAAWLILMAQCPYSGTGGH